VVQKFLPAVKDGDKRIILVDGEFAGAVNRVPAPDDLRSNMVRGGVPKATDLTARERKICARLGPPLRQRGLLFVGIDVIDGFLTEINVTSRRPRRRGDDLGQDRREAEIVQPRAGPGDAALRPAGDGLAMVSTKAAAMMHSAPATKKAGR
jgi:hypothetical protein